jgi:hypothetical protein
VTLLEGALIYMLFPQILTDPGPIARYTFTPPGTLVAWLLAAAVTAAFVVYAAMGSPVIRTHMLVPATWGAFIGVRFIAIPMAFVTGFFEEAFYRKFLMDVMMHHNQSAVVQVAISAAVFGIAHGIWGLFGGNVRAAVGPTISTGVLGGALAIVYLIGGRSLAPCATAHVVINLFLEPWLIITAATNAWGRKPSA